MSELEGDADEFGRGPLIVLKQRLYLSELLEGMDQESLMETFAIVLELLTVESMDKVKDALLKELNSLDDLEDDNILED